MRGGERFSAGARSRTSALWCRTIVGLPDRIPLVLFWTTVASVGLLLGELFDPLLALGMGVAFTALSWPFTQAPFRADRSSAAASLLMLVGTGVWVWANLPYVSRFVVVVRDAGFLTLQAFWLRHSQTAAISVSDAALSAARSVEHAELDMGGYTLMGDVVHAQGASTLPAVLSIAGRIAGDEGIYAGNVVIGGVALLAVYGLARQLVGPWWATVPVVALAAGQPWLYLTRTNYTEPFTVALAFAGMTFLCVAISGRRPHLAVIGGALVGSTALVRVDGAAQVIGLIAGLGLAAGFALLPRWRTALWRITVAASVPALAMVALGWVVLRVQSTRYLDDISGQYRTLVQALVAVGLVVLMLAPRAGWGSLRRFAQRRRRVLGIAVAVLVLALAALLASRPWWWVARFPAAPAVHDLIKAIQLEEGLPVDPTRSFDELSVAWVAWYWGWIVVILGFAGWAVTGFRAFAHRDPRFMVILGIVAAPSALYLSRVSITPDQVWAIRRLVPVTIPGLLIGATITLSLLWRSEARRARPWTRLVAACLAVAVAVWPFTTWYGMERAVEQGGRDEQIQAICDAIDGRPTIFVRGVIPYLMTIRSVCNVDVVQLASGDPASLRAAAAAWDGQGVALVSFSMEGHIAWTEDSPDPLHSATITDWGQRLERPVDIVHSHVSSVWAGTIDPDTGQVTPVTGRDAASADQPEEIAKTK